MKIQIFDIYYFIIFIDPQMKIIGMFFMIFSSCAKNCSPFNEGTVGKWKKHKFKKKPPPKEKKPKPE